MKARGDIKIIETGEVVGSGDLHYTFFLLRKDDPVRQILSTSVLNANQREALRNWLMTAYDMGFDDGMELDKEIYESS